MAGFNDCIRSAQEQGVLSQDEADALIARYDEHRRARAEAGDADAEGAAKTALAGEYDAEAARKRLIADLTGAEAGRDQRLPRNYRNLKDQPDVFEARSTCSRTTGTAPPLRR